MLFVGGPAIALVLLIPILTLLRSCQDGEPGYALVVAHEAPVTSDMTLGSAADNALRITESKVDKHHGQLASGGSGTWAYTHVSRVRSAEYPRPAKWAGWDDGASPPRFTLTASSVLLTGVPRAMEITAEMCSGEQALPEGVRRHTARSVPSSTLDLIDGQGNSLGLLMVPQLAGESVELMQTTLEVCSDLSFKLGGCDAGLPIAASTGFWGLGWERTELQQYAGSVFGGGAEFAEAMLRRDKVWPWQKTTEHFVAVDSNTPLARVVGMPDGQHPEPIREADGKPPSVSLLRRSNKRGLEAVAHPAVGEKVVHCTLVPQRWHHPRWVWGMLGAEKRWSVQDRGIGNVPADGLLLVGVSRYKLSQVERPWGDSGQTTSVLQVEPVDRPTSLKVLRSLSAGRLYQPGHSYELPSCNTGIKVWGEPRSYAILQVNPTPVELADRPDPNADDLAWVQETLRVDAVTRSAKDLAAVRPVIALQAPNWAMADVESEQADLALLHLCQGWFTGNIHSRVVSPYAKGHPLFPDMDRGDAELSTDEWTKHANGDRIALAGQVFELRESIPLFERVVPLLLLMVLVLVAGQRALLWMNPLALQTGEDTDTAAADPFAWFLPVVLGAVSFLILVGCLVQGDSSANPRLQGNPDFLHRTWFTSAFAIFAIPASLAAYGRWKWGVTEFSNRIPQYRNAFRSFGQEMGIGLGCIAVACVLDAVLWKMSGNAPDWPLSSPVQTRVTISIVILGLSGVAAYKAELGWELQDRVLAALRERWIAWRTQDDTDDDPSDVVEGDLSEDDWDDLILADRSDLTDDESEHSDETAPKPSDAASAEPWNRWQWARQSWDAFRYHQAIGRVFGAGGGDLLAVILVPVWLLGFAVLARARGGAAHNNLEFGVLGLGFKPAEIAAVLLGFALARILTRTWSRAGGTLGERVAVVSQTGRWARFIAWTDPEDRLIDPSGTNALRNRWLRRTWFAVVFVRWGIALLIFAALVGLWLNGTVQIAVVGAAVIAGLSWEGAVRWAPALAPVMAVVAMILGVTTVTFGIQGDFGPLMVTVPAILATVFYWAMPRSRERLTDPENARGRRAVLVRFGAVLVLILGTVVAGHAAYTLAFDLQDHVSEMQRATDRFLISSDPWYALGADWSIKAQWIASGAYESHGVAWVANLHSDLAWIAVIQSFGITLAGSTGAAFALLALILIGVAEHTLERSERPGVADRQALREAGFFCAFTSFYLVAEVVVHICSCFGWIPPTGLTLPWVSNGGSASLSYALLIGIALGAVMSARRQDLRRELRRARSGGQ
jgi:cell division protein FtsW (lipid II flippase)